MHVHLSDVLTCPRCGPEFGLVLLADKIEARRIIDGWLGCSNCRERYRVHGGHADLVFGEPVPAAQAASDAAALRWAALLGVAEGPATVLLVGSGAGNAERIADMIEGVEIVAAATGLSESSERPGVSRVAVGNTLPFRSRSMNGVALTEQAVAGLVEEAARVVAPRGRVVVQSSGDQAAQQLEQHGLRIVARDASAVVAERGVF